MTRQNWQDITRQVRVISPDRHVSARATRAVAISSWILPLVLAKKSLSIEAEEIKLNLGSELIKLINLINNSSAKTF